MLCRQQDRTAPRQAEATIASAHLLYLVKWTGKEVRIVGVTGSHADNSHFFPCPFHQVEEMSAFFIKIARQKR
jgi:hypothetical protein